MENAWEEVQPKNIFRSAKQTPLKDHGKEALIHLYQPIIGAQGLSLYFSLLGSIVWQVGLSESIMHSDLLTDCNIGLQQFFEARLKLEGIGLLAVFRRFDPELGNTYLYQLQDPLSPENFMKDSLLTFLLQERVSEKKFSALIKRFQPNEIDTSDYQEITRSFSQVYGFNEARFAASYEKLADYTQRFELNDRQEVQLAQSALDWELLESNLKKQGISTDFSDEVRNDIRLSHIMYGMDELELGDLLAKTSDIVKGAVDIRRFKQMVRRLYQQKIAPAQPEEPEQMAHLSEADKETYRYNSLKMEGFNEAEIEVLEEMQKTPPAIYANAIKKEKGGFLTDPEKWLIRNLISQTGLPASVINCLINYVLVVKDSPSLNSSYVNTIANEWVQKGIRSPEAAFKHIAEVNEPKEKPEKRGYSQRKKPVRREKIPEWMNKKNIPEAKLSPERQAELDKKLKEFLEEGDE